MWHHVPCRVYEVRIPRVEVEEVDGLRQGWEELLQLADRVREDLMKEKRNAFEQELDKQVKVSQGHLRSVCQGDSRSIGQSHSRSRSLKQCGSRSFNKCKATRKRKATRKAWVCITTTWMCSVGAMLERSSANITLEMEIYAYVIVETFLRAFLCGWDLKLTIKKFELSCQGIFLVICGALV